MTTSPGKADTPAAESNAAVLPISISATDSHIRYTGRFDTRDPAGPRCEWSASEIALRFKGTALNARLYDTWKDDHWQVEIDGKPAQKLALLPDQHTYSVAAGLEPGEHTVRLVKATEAFCGITQFLGFELSDGGKLLPLDKPKRQIEVIGDSISCGYGNEGKSQTEKFSPATENAYSTYGAITARKLNAGYTCIAWSGRKMWPDNTTPEIYDLNLPLEPASKWTPDTKVWSPDAIVINLATNDFGPSNPDEAKWTGAYRAFIGKLRAMYPKAEIYCAIGPMLGDWGDRKPLSTVRGYLTGMVAKINTDGDKHVHLIEFDQQKMEDGIGSDWHPSIRTHEIMAARLTETLKRDLHW